MVIVDPAYKPTHPSKPSRSLIAGGGLAGAILLAICVALALALLDDRLYDRVDVESLGAVPLLAVVPRKPKPKKKKGKLG
jgi:capsular polysaccharide biosynthesis protein